MKPNGTTTDADHRVQTGPEFHELSGTHWPMLGTVVDIRITARDRADAEGAELIVCDEISRLEKVFSVYDDTSTLRRWVADPTTATSDEFDELLATALEWQRCSRGAFNVGTRRLWNLWVRAAEDGRQPGPGELSVLVGDIRDAPYRFDGFVPEQTGDCDGLDLNAIAKGFIVDLAIETAWGVCDLVSLTVCAGGDIAHRGPTPIEVGIEDPTTKRDDAPSLQTVSLRNAAIATSGSARRGVSVGGEWISHVLDPRTGHPAYGSASVTVVAPNAATADVVATIVSIMEPAEGQRFVDSLNATGRGPIECWIVDRSGGIRHTGI